MPTILGVREKKWVGNQRTLASWELPLGSLPAVLASVNWQALWTQSCFVSWWSSWPCPKSAPVAFLYQATCVQTSLPPSFPNFPLELPTTKNPNLPIIFFFFWQIVKVVVPWCFIGYNSVSWTTPVKNIERSGGGSKPGKHNLKP